MYCFEGGRGSIDGLSLFSAAVSRFQMMPQRTNDDDAYCLQQQFQNISSTSKIGSYTFHYYRDFESIEG